MKLTRDHVGQWIGAYGKQLRHVHPHAQLACASSTRAVHAQSMRAQHAHSTDRYATALHASAVHGAMSLLGGAAH